MSSEEYEEYDDEVDFIDEYSDGDKDSDFDNRTWKVIVTVPDGFAIGAQFTFRDIVYMARMIPCLEGMVFENIRTGKEKMLRNKDINSKKIIAQARTDLVDTEYEHLLFGLSSDRPSVDLLVTRINRCGAGGNPVIVESNFYQTMKEYFGEEPCQ